MMTKVSKDSVDYRPGTNEEHCGICTMFREPNRCTLVAGIIRKPDTCDRFDPKTKRAA